MEEQTSLESLTSLEPEFEVESLESVSLLATDPTVPEPAPLYDEAQVEDVMEASPLSLEIMEEFELTMDTEQTLIAAVESSEAPQADVKEPDENIHIDLAEIARAVPDKMAFKIGEVAEITGLKPYVLRYWESEFDSLTPQKSAFNQRMYSRRDVETVLLIKKLLYEEKFSIAGAKKKIKDLRKGLKVEKQKIAVMDRFEQAVELVESLVVEVTDLKKLFQ